MAIKLFGGRVTIGKDLSQYAGTADNYYSFVYQQYGTDYKSRSKLKAYKDAVYACTSFIGEAMGGYSPMVQVKKGDEWQTVADHPLVKLINQPGGTDLDKSGLNKFDLMEATIIYALLQGHVYWYLAKGKTSGLPREIVILRADKVGTDIDPKTGQINGYFIRQDMGPTIPLEVDEVEHFKFFNPENPYEGMSVIEAGQNYIGTDENTAKFTNNFFGNNAGLSGVLNVKGEVTKNAFKKFVRAWKEKYQGVDNAGKVAILRDSDASFTKVGLGLDEIDMRSIRTMSLADVFMLFKVPQELLGKITEGSGLGRGNIETLEYVFAKWNIDKKMIRMDNMLMHMLQRFWKVEYGTTRVIHENIIPDDAERKLLERDKAVDRWQTRNEIRSEDGMDEIDGGDQLFVPINNIPLGDDPMADTDSQAKGGTGIKVKLIRKGGEEPQKKKTIVRQSELNASD